MITEYFNPVLWPFIKIWLVSGILILILFALHRIAKNLLLGTKEKIWSDIKKTSMFIIGVYILSLGLFWFMMSLYVIGNPV